MKWVLLIPAGLIALVAVIALLGAFFIPRDHVATRSVTYHQSPAALFAVVRDFAALPSWRNGLSATELLPPRDGVVTFREVSRHGAILYAVREERVGERLVLEIADKTLPYGGRWIFEFRPTPAGTELRITEQGFVKNIVFRFLARFVFGHTRTLENYHRDLAKKFAESAPVFH